MPVSDGGRTSRNRAAEPHRSRPGWPELLSRMRPTVQCGRTRTRLGRSTRRRADNQRASRSAGASDAMRSGSSVSRGDRSERGRPVSVSRRASSAATSAVTSSTMYSPPGVKVTRTPREVPISWAATSRGCQRLDECGKHRHRRERAAYPRAHSDGIESRHAHVPRGQVEGRGSPEALPVGPGPGRGGDHVDRFDKPVPAVGQRERHASVLVGPGRQPLAPARARSSRSQAHRRAAAPDRSTQTGGAIPSFRGYGFRSATSSRRQPEQRVPCGACCATRHQGLRATHEQFVRNLVRCARRRDQRADLVEALLRPGYCANFSGGSSMARGWLWYPIPSAQCHQP